MFDIERYKSHLSYEDLLWYYLMAQTEGISGEINQEIFPKDYKQMKEDLDFLNAKSMAKDDDI